MSTKDLIDAIEAGNADAIQTTFESEMANRIADRLTEMRASVAKNMFTPQIEEEIDLGEEIDLDEEDGKKLHPDHVHVSKAPGNKYKVHAVGSNFSHGLKVGEHVNDTHLDDLGEMGAHVKMIKAPK